MWWLLRLPWVKGLRMHACMLRERAGCGRNVPSPCSLLGAHAASARCRPRPAMHGHMLLRLQLRMQPLRRPLQQWLLCMHGLMLWLLMLGVELGMEVEEGARLGLGLAD